MSQFLKMHHSSRLSHLIHPLFPNFLKMNSWFIQSINKLSFLMLNFPLLHHLVPFKFTLGIHNLWFQHLLQLLVYHLLLCLRILCSLTLIYQLHYEKVLVLVLTMFPQSLIMHYHVLPKLLLPLYTLLLFPLLSLRT